MLLSSNHPLSKNTLTFPSGYVMKLILDIDMLSVAFKIAARCVICLNAMLWKCLTFPLHSSSDMLPWLPGRQTHPSSTTRWIVDEVVIICTTGKLWRMKGKTSCKCRSMSLLLCYTAGVWFPWFISLQWVETYSVHWRTETQKRIMNSRQ